MGNEREEKRSRKREGIIEGIGGRGKAVEKDREHKEGGMAFETEDDLISESRNWFDNLDVDFFRMGINSLLSRWQKCIDLHGDYVEK
ncbi:histone-lysine N-methyltransferase SETMAR [Plakobranchus ocellatus]|uniref:Histone-lysine N-methyltransferase SETMAR n=1 Tax=Plakobranchus ocellatus TaxID=259542 RepID=A0AAV4B8Q6_9GAST|nr:histone-lysine N-methyltransferase SETMAR [Plakobranchus ocellatus]